MINKKSDVVYPPNTWELKKELIKDIRSYQVETKGLREENEKLKENIKRADNDTKEAFAEMRIEHHKEVENLEEVIEEMHDVIKLLEEEHEEDIMDLNAVIRYLENKIKDTEYIDEYLTSDEVHKMVGG